MVDDAGRLVMMTGGCLPPPIPCASRLAPFGPLLSSAKQQEISREQYSIMVVNND